MCNELFHNDNVIVKHDLIYYLFFLLCVGSFEVKYIICKCPIYLYKKKAKRKKLHLWEIYVLLQSETSFYIVIFIFRYPYQNENCVFFAIFIFVCGMKYQCVKKKIFDGKKLQKTSKGKKTSFSQRKPHIKIHKKWSQFSLFNVTTFHWIDIQSVHFECAWRYLMFATQLIVL